MGFIEFFETNKAIGVIFGVLSLVIGLGYSYFWFTGEPVVFRTELVPDNFGAFTIAPFVFMHPSEEFKELDFDFSETEALKHEEVHIIQNWMFLAGGNMAFYGSYGADFLYQYSKYRDWSKAYINIFLEKQAYEYQEKFKLHLDESIFDQQK